MRTIGITVGRQPAVVYGIWDQSSGGASVFVMETADMRECYDCSPGRQLDRAWLWTLLV